MYVARNFDLAFGAWPATFLSTKHLTRVLTAACLPRTGK